MGNPQTMRAAAAVEDARGALAHWQAQDGPMPDWAGAEAPDWPAGWWLLPATMLGLAGWGAIGWLIFG